MKHYEHFLFPAKGDSYPSALVSVDVVGEEYQPETGIVRINERFKSWHAVSGVREGNSYANAKEYSGTEPMHFWTLLYRLCKKRGNTVVVCPCAPRVWPMLLVWDLLEREELRLSGCTYDDMNELNPTPGRFNNALIVLEEPVHVLKLRFADVPGTITLLDSRNYGVDVRKEGQSVHCAVSRGYMLVAGIVEALRASGCGSLQCTAASQAMYTFRRKFLRDTILSHACKEALDLEQQAYVGGRCEAFCIGVQECQIYHLDYSSLYASCCLWEEVPSRLITYASGCASPSGVKWERKLARISDVSVKTSVPAFPKKGHSRTYYPTGQFRTTLCGPELELAEKMKVVEHYHSTAWYEATPALEGYAAFWLEKRQLCRKNSWSDLESWVKKLLVCLPGKFGQQSTRWQDCTDILSDHPYHTWTKAGPNSERTRYRSIAWHVQKQVNEGWSADAVPSIAAWICSAGRVRLWYAMITAGLENVYYVDTDAVVTNSVGYDRLHQGGLVGAGEPGKLRLLWSGEGCEIRGWKDYTVGRHTVLSGVPRGSTPDASPGGYVWIRPGIDEAMRSNEPPSSKRVLVRHAYNRKYEHGRVEGNGLVSPWRLPEDAHRLK